jgi:hypothetical protein
MTLNDKENALLKEALENILNLFLMLKLSICFR